MGNHGGYDCWIIKLNATGNIQWQKTLGGSADDYGFTTRQTTEGGYILASYSFSNNGNVTVNHGSADSWIVKLSTTGGIQWQKTFGGSNIDRGVSVEQTSDGGYIIGGDTESIDGDVINNQGNSDYWIIKLGPDPLSTVNFQKDGITIFPNPASSVLNLQFPKDATSDKVVITDLTGKIILEHHTQDKQFNIENLTSGMYLLQVYSGDKQWVCKTVNTTSAPPHLKSSQSENLWRHNPGYNKSGAL